MAAKFYDQSKENRDRMVADMQRRILNGLQSGISMELSKYAASPDTHIRKWAYTIVGRIYRQQPELRKQILSTVRTMLKDPRERTRQAAVYAAGEIGDLNAVSDILESGLRDGHHSVRNGVIGALKVMGAKDPKPVLAFAREHLKDSDPEVRRQVIHGVELRGRTHPGEVLPLLRQMQNETSSRVRKMIVHVLGQISYREGCLETVVAELGQWKNEGIVRGAIKSILSVHREQTYCVYSYEEAKGLIDRMIPALRR